MFTMKKYLLNLLELRMKQLTRQMNDLENQYRGATASGLSGYNASREEVRKEMEKIESYKERLQELDVE